MPIASDRARYVGLIDRACGMLELRRRLSSRGCAAVLAAAAVLGSGAARAVPPGFTNEVVVPGISAATTIAFLPDGRMLVGELTEKIWVVQPGANAPDPTPFLQLSGSAYLQD